MTRKQKRVLLALAYGCLAITLGACASAFMKGGALVGAGYQPLMAYSPIKSDFF